MPPFIRRPRMRRPRRKTRWIAIAPGASVAPASAAYTVIGLTLQDRSGTVDIAEFYGATILRVILDVTVAHTLSINEEPNSGFLTSHAGLFVVEDDAPGSTVWSPNSPSGDFMQRSTFSQEFHTDTGYALQWNSGNETSRDGNGHHFDTNVRRKLGENSRLWMTMVSFYGGGMFGVDYGYTGRVLVALP